VGEPLPPGACRVRLEAIVPDRLAADTVHEHHCLVGNEGGAILVSAPPYPVHISYRWFDRCDSAIVIEGDRSLLPEALPPGSEQSCRFRLRTPARQGDYRLVITLVQEHVAWFDDVDKRNAWSGDVRIS
jgi:hypothetical protein